jgi:hypothetical protein
MPNAEPLVVVAPAEPMPPLAQDTPPEPVASSPLPIKPGPEASPSGWMQSQHRQAVALAWILLACYIAPVALGAVALYSSDWMQQESSALKWFAAFLRDSDNTLNEFHKVLLPVVAAVSIVAFTGKPSREMLWLAAFVLVSFTTTVAVSVSFDIKDVAEGMTGLAADLAPEQAKQFLARIRETLMSFLMMLLGVGVVNGSLAPPAGAAR